ncbi:helix-turn-helix domain-containing protein [Shewanella pneumatophori]|uniref:Helix-turn-helix domain-containing protein n=1 Tax=Shewanella pneumatophori TaxID=314092 RepID=A0A9X1ZAY7_9GAMM|nr:helix-turn-helix transcriptional regulator [Shewanella pneumatophori]MCL1137175.1 helix-turn-helix domain-containing protein [Shewanella pneumatophori]
MEHDMTFTNYCYTKNKRNHVFSTFLKKIRANNVLSQEQLCLQLRQHSSLFYNLDSITVSRWERGVNIPSLAKQAEIVELYDNELTCIYACDKQFIQESSHLIKTDSEQQKSIHPYYRNDEYYIQTIDIRDDRFYLVLKMILRYEGNPTLKLNPPLEEFDSLNDLKISVATAFNGQIIGHSLFLTTTENVIKEIAETNKDLRTIINSSNRNEHDAMIVFSSSGATKQVENSIMSTYLNQFSQQKKMRYFCFYTCDGNLVRKLSTAKLKPFRHTKLKVQERVVNIRSYFLKRSELMANRFLLKLAIITPQQLGNLLGTNKKETSS